ADLDVEIVLQVAAAAGGSRDLAFVRLGDLHVLAARGRLDVGGQLRRIVADARFLHGVARLRVQVLVVVLADLAERLADRVVLLSHRRDVRERQIRAAQDDETDDHRQQRQRQPPGARRHARPFGADDLDRPAKRPADHLAHVTEGVYGHLALTVSVNCFAPPDTSVIAPLLTSSKQSISFSLAAMSSTADAESTVPLMNVFLGRISSSETSSLIPPPAGFGLASSTGLVPSAGGGATASAGGILREI